MGKKARRLKQARKREAATREILRVIARSPDDYGPVFRTILDNAVRLCRAPFGTLFLVRDGHLHVVADANSRPEFLEHLRANPIPLDGSGVVLQPAVLTRKPVQVADLERAHGSTPTPAYRTAAVHIGGVRTLLGVPIVKHDEAVGVIALYRLAVEPFDDDEVEVVSTFADQAVIAIENVRQFQALQGRTAELTETLARQTATSEILRVISRSPTDYEPVFDTILANATRLCDAPLGTLFLHEDGALRAVKTLGGRAAFLDFLRGARYPVDDRTVVGRSALSRATVQVDDISADPGYTKDNKLRSASVDVEGIRTLLSVPMLRGDELLGAITLYRREVMPFDDDQVALIETFADQAVIAIENVRSFQAVQARTADLTESLERQTATSEILRAISRSPTDYAPVFDTILANAVRLCGAPFGTLFLRRDGHLHVVADAGSRPEMIEHLRANPIALDEPNSVSSRAVRERVPKQVADMMDDAYRSGDPRRIAAVEIGGVRTWLCVPMLKGDDAIGVIALYRTEVDPFADNDVELVRTFADQAVIAIENVRSFQAVQARTAELTKALERQTATSEILRSISRSPTDYAPVFDTILENATRLCGAPFGTLLMVRGDHLHHVAYLGGRPEDVEHRWANPIPLSDPSSIMAAVIRECAPRQLADSREDAHRSGNPRRIAAAEVGGMRTVIGVPLLKDDAAVGVIALYREEVKTFADEDVALVRTFADQAVIAIENVRLFQEIQARTAALTKSLERQTATSEILRSISRSPTDYAPVFDTILDNAVRLCGAHFAYLFLVRDGCLHVVASLGGTPEFADFYRDTPFPLDHPNSVTSRAARERQVVHIVDITDTPAYRARDSLRLNEAIDLGGIRTFVAVPMLKGDTPVGVLGLYRREVKPFEADEIELVSTFADQAVIAIENVRLFQEIEARTGALTQSLERQTATSEILRSISRSPTDYAPVFDTILDNATRLCDASLGNLFLLQDGHLTSVASVGGRPAFLEYLANNPVSVDARTAVGRAALERRTVQVEDSRAAAQVDGPQSSAARVAAAELEGVRTFLAVPMLRDEQIVGVIGVYRREVRPFNASLTELLETFADQAVIAIENVRLFQALETRSGELARSVTELEALGEVAQAVSSTLDLDTVLRTIIERAVQLSGAHAGAINEFDEATGTLPPRAAPGLETLLELPDPRLGEGAVGRAAVTRAPVQIPDIAAPGAYTGHLMKALSDLRIRALLAVPMIQDDRVLGTLVVARRTPGEFPPETVRLLRALGTQSAIAIGNARLFREIEDKSRELEAANRHKSEFLANMSHELRTPLNAVIGFSEVLGERMFGELNDKQAEYVKDIHDSGRHLLSLINDILDLSKIEAGAMDLDVSRFALVPALDNALTLVRERAGRRGIALESRFDGDLGEMEGDERKLKQILLNLLSNAVKFTPEGGRVTLQARQDGANVYIAVRDTGVGISEEDQAVIFDEFKQVGTDYARKVEGTGLGLTLTRRFVEMHGGHIAVQSEPGAGSVFEVTLPLRPAGDTA